MNLPPVVRWATGIRWQWKVFIPIIAVLLLSIVAIAAVLRTLAIQEAQIILIASVCFAILLCFVLLSVLLVLVERPLGGIPRPGSASVSQAAQSPSRQAPPPQFRIDSSRHFSIEYSPCPP